jgi:hypothetical protein
MILYFPYFESPDPDRHEEILVCLQENIKNEYIKKIIVVLEKPIIDFYFKSDKLVFWDLYKRPTYSDMFKHANEFYINETCIIANSDIYFNNTLNHLVNFDLQNLFLCLTRYDLNLNGELIYMNKDFMMRSQDSWIFKSPVPDSMIDNSKFYLGTNACDNMISRIASDNGLITTNPSLLIETIHLHNSNIRTYNSTTGIYGICEFIWPVDSLDVISFKKRYLLSWENNIYI